MDELEQKTKKRVKAIVRSNLTGLSMMQKGWYLSYLPLNVVDKLPAVSLKPLPIDIGKAETPYRPHDEAFVQRHRAVQPPEENLEKTKRLPRSQCNHDARAAA